MKDSFDDTTEDTGWDIETTVVDYGDGQPLPNYAPRPTNSYTGQPSQLGRIIKLEAKTDRLQMMVYAEAGGLLLVGFGLFAGARTVAKIIKMLNEIGPVFQAITQGPPTPVQQGMQARPMPRAAQPIGEVNPEAARDVIDETRITTPAPATGGFDPGVQDVPEEVRRELEQMSGLDELFNGGEDV